MIDTPDNTAVKTFLETDEWLNLILLMQNEHLLKNYNIITIIEKIESMFRKIRARKGPVISIDINKVDKVIEKQHGNQQKNQPASLGHQYISDLQNFS